MKTTKINEAKANYLLDIATKVYQVDAKNRVRHRFNVFARSAISVQLRKDGEGYAEIGRFLNKDRASIMHGIRKHNDCMAFDKEYKQLYTSFLLEINRPVNQEKGISDDMNFRAVCIVKDLINAGLDAIEIMNFWEDCYDKEIKNLNQ